MKCNFLENKKDIWYPMKGKIYLNWKHMAKTYKHLTLNERQSIEILLNRWSKQKEIAKVILKSETCISLELNRNWVKNKWSEKKKYLALEAHTKAYQRRWRVKTQSMKINLNTEMKNFIIFQIQRTDIETSPKVIAYLWNKSQKEKKNHITHTSIYAWFETWNWNKFKEFLLYKYKWYNKKKATKWSKIKWRIHLEERPDEANNRPQKWYYEADLIVSKKGFRWALLTLIDRKTRLPRIIKLKSKKSKKIMKEIIKLKEEIWIKSITFDNWMEFALHKLLNKVWIDTYFSKPYSPREKWAIENFNRMVRRFFPKGTIFNNITKKKIKNVCLILANTPREILGFLSPNQVHFK